MSALRLVKSSGTPSLDKAAEYALSSSRLLPLPDDYGPPRVTMQVSFYYNEAPQGS
jgi:outer membrane biosynthesis protein TonB